jgi:hypothetical protein
MKKIIFCIVLIVSLVINFGFIIQNNYIFLAYHEMRVMVHDVLVFAGIRKQVHATVYADAVIVYYANELKVSYVSPQNQIKTFKKAPCLPSDLIIKPGVYEFYGNIYNLKKPGLYRFMKPHKENAQRIVFQKGDDVQILLSSLAWIITHGYRDDAKSFGQWMQIAKKRKLILICSKTAELVKQILTEEGFRVRLVQTATLESPRTGFNDLHAMDEVYIPKYRRWILFDIDNGVYFTHNGHKLSLFGFLKYSQNEDYKLNFIANDTRVDISNYQVKSQTKNEYSFGFLAELIDANLKLWYKRVVQIGIVPYGEKLYFTTNNTKDREYVIKHYPWYSYVPRDVFIRNVYSDQVKH